MVMLVSCTQEQKNNNEITTVQSTDVKTDISVKENWIYADDIDNMTSKKRYFAYNMSSDTIDFLFPYEGGSTFKLAIRNIDNENQLLMICSKGQFMPSYGTGEIVRVKFDNENPLNVYYTVPTDGSTNIIFLDEINNQLISKLKTSKKIIIEATFYNEGNKQISFNVQGLKWDH